MRGFGLPGLRMEVTVPAAKNKTERDRAFQRYAVLSKTAASPTGYGTQMTDRVQHRDAKGRPTETLE